jgi:hypothetical protein
MAWRKSSPAQGANTSNKGYHYYWGGNRGYGGQGSGGLYLNWGGESWHW